MSQIPSQIETYEDEESSPPLNLKPSKTSKSVHSKSQTQRINVKNSRNDGVILVEEGNLLAISPLVAGKNGSKGQQQQMHRT